MTVSAPVTHTRHEYGVREEAKEFPMMVVLSFIYVCNAGCPNCPYNNSEIREDYTDALFMPEDLFKRIADECGPHGSMLRISGGGEPMLHPKAVELLEYAKSKGTKVGLITNGSSFDEGDLERLVSAGVDAIEFSVDAGDPETYAWVRPGLDWDTLNANVRKTLALRDRLNASTRVVVSAINQAGVDIAKVEAHWVPIADKVQIRKYLTWGYNENHSADSTPYLPPEQRVPCPWLFERLNIDSRGFVTLCGEDIAFNEKFANVNERSIKDIWNGPEFGRLRGLHLGGRGDEIPICSTCPDWQFRSWEYNYWKIIKDADAMRGERAKSGE
jgi:MoaA/NifB/PqqE/SkfB family radical SAM enzyme